MPRPEKPEPPDLCVWAFTLSTSPLAQWVTFAVLRGIAVVLDVTPGALPPGPSGQRAATISHDATQATAFPSVPGIAASPAGLTPPSAARRCFEGAYAVISDDLFSHPEVEAVIGAILVGKGETGVESPA